MAILLASQHAADKLATKDPQHRRMGLAWPTRGSALHFLNVARVQASPVQLPSGLTTACEACQAPQHSSGCSVGLQKAVTCKHAINIMQQPCTCMSELSNEFCFSCWLIEDGVQPCMNKAEAKVDEAMIARRAVQAMSAYPNLRVQVWLVQKRVEAKPYLELLQCITDTQHMPHSVVNMQN